MITTITRFNLPEPISAEDAKRVFLSTAPIYREMLGLYRKAYVIFDEGNAVGGIYLWESRAHADAVYTDSWKATVREKYGSDPEIQYLPTPVVVDNVQSEILTAP